MGTTTVGKVTFSGANISTGTLGSVKFISVVSGNGTVSVTVPVTGTVLPSPPA